MPERFLKGEKAGILQVTRPRGRVETAPPVPYLRPSTEPRKRFVPDSVSHPRTLRNILSNWGTFILFAVAGFFISPFIVHKLGDSLYGIWAIVGSAVGYLGLLDVGVRGAVTRYMARYAVLDDLDSANRLASSAKLLFAGLSTIAVLLGVGLALAGPHFFHIPPDHVREARIALLAAGGTVALTLQLGMYGGTLAALHRWTQVNSLEICFETMRIAAIIWALSSGGGIIALAIIQLSLGAARLIVYSWLCRRVLPGLRPKFSLASRAMIGTIIAFGGYSTLLNASSQLVLYSDTVVIGAILPVSAVTYFAIAGNLIEYVRRVLSGISFPLTPLASATDAIDPSAVSRLLQRSVRLSTLVIAPILITFFVRGGSFVSLWMGPEYRETAGKVLIILSVATYFGAAYHMLTVTMLGLNRHRVLLPLFVVEALSNVVISVLLARAMGVVGVAIGTLIPRLVVTTLLGPPIARSELGISRQDYVIDAWVRPALAMVGFAAASYLVEETWRAGSLGIFFLQVFLLLPIAVGGAWILSLQEDERHWARAKIAHLFRPFRTIPSAS